MKTENGFQKSKHVRYLQVTACVCVRAGVSDFHYPSILTIGGDKC